VPWIQTHLTVDKSQAPLVELLFENLGALSVTLGDAGDEPMLEPAPGETPLWSATRVTGLFPGDTDIDHLRAALNDALAREPGRSLEIEILEDRDWERAWLDRFAPMRFGERLWIRPGGQPVDAGPEAAIVDLDPGLAFGTGTHPTTALCLEWLDAHPPAGHEVIDFGCGSGILGIAALKLGARHVLCVDHDPQAVLATRENAQRNAVADRLSACDDHTFEDRPAQLVLANILANVLIELAPRIGGLVTPGGDLVLSGILAEQAEAVADAYGDLFDFQPPQEHEGWVLLHGRRREKSA
jgi:ribosomal protein L11 methyltransferase